MSWVEFRLQDYRLVPETFDRIVSVGMFEHVGVAHYGEFFAKVNELLADNGLMLLHSIGRSEGPGVTNPWIAKYIFPGGIVPSIEAIERTLAAHTSLAIVDRRDFGVPYSPRT